LEVLAQVVEWQDVLPEQLGHREHYQGDQQQQQAVFSHRGTGFIGNKSVSTAKDRIHGPALQILAKTKSSSLIDPGKRTDGDADPGV
jgi:hypothetical protein